MLNLWAMRAFGLALIASVLVFGGCRWQHRIDAGQIADLKAQHAAVLTAIAAQAQVVADKAAAARAAYGDAVLADQSKYEQGVSDAYNRGKSAGAAIASGAVRVREPWRDQCPQAPAGQGAEPDAGPSGVDPSRADAIGRVLGLAGQWDAAYGLAYGRLIRAQELLNACYEEPMQ